MREIILELLEIYLRRAGLADKTIDGLLAHTLPVDKLVNWLGELAPELTEDAIDDRPIEW
jgi:hypothetical protein